MEKRAKYVKYHAKLKTIYRLVSPVTTKQMSIELIIKFRVSNDYYWKKHAKSKCNMFLAVPNYYEHVSQDPKPTSPLPLASHSNALPSFLVGLDMYRKNVSAHR